MAFFEANLNLMNTILIALGIVLVVGVLAVVVYKIVRMNIRSRHAKQEQARAAQEQAIEEGVQKRLEEIRNESFVMSRNTMYGVGNDGQIAAGKYVVKSSVSTDNTFNIRLNGLVEPYKNGTVITLAEGDTICPVSEAVLLNTYVGETTTKENE